MTVGSGVVAAQLDIDLLKTMPKWAERDTQCAPVKAEWDRVYAELDAHENKHVADDKGIFGGLHAKLPTGLTRDEAGKKIDAAVEASNTASNTFHGTPAGSKKPAVNFVTCGGPQKVP